MKKNVGNIDKLIRLIIAVVIFLYVYKEDKSNGTLDIVLLIIAFIAAFTSLLNYCPIYSIFGIKTTNKKIKH